MQPIITAVEGNSFSGKTTLTEEVHKKIGCPIIKEYFHYVDHFPSFPFEDYEAAKSNVDFFIEAEIRRSQEAMDKSIQTGLPVVMDRSPFSIIVFQYAVNKLLPNIPNAYAYSWEAFQKALDESKIIIPPSIILLEPSDNDFLSRVRNRGKVDVDFLNDVLTKQVMHSWYKRIIDTKYKQNGLILKSIEGKVDETARLAIEFILNADGANNLNFNPLREN